MNATMQKVTWNDYVRAIDEAMTTGRFASRFDAGCHIQRRDPAMRAAALAGPDATTGSPSRPRQDVMSRAVAKLTGQQVPEREPESMSPLDAAVLRMLRQQGPAKQQQPRQTPMDRAIAKLLRGQGGSGGRG